MKILAFLFGFILFLYMNVWPTYAMSIFKDTSEVIYCQDDECSLSEWTDLVKDHIQDIETQVPASVYIQNVVVYLLTFITIIAIFYIIYAGFKLLTSAGDEDEFWKAKITIVSVIIGIVIIWLSYSIVDWIIWVVATQGTQEQAFIIYHEKI